MSQSRTPTPLTLYRVSKDLKFMQWPEENLSLDVDERGGFYPAKLGEVFDEGRFVVTRKLGWGGFGNVRLARDRKENRHVALKILSVHASREVLRTIIAAAPSHQGFPHVLHFLHEFTVFMGATFASSPQKQLPDPRLPLKFILRLVKHVLKALEYLHDTCGVVHSGPADLKPSNILLLPSNVDSIVMHELAELPSTLYELLKTIPPEEVPFHAVSSAPIIFTLNLSQTVTTQLHWVVADMHLSDLVQPYALRAPEVVPGLEWGPAIDIWSLGCLMYEWATSNWLFSPEGRDGVSRDLIHLAQMTERTGQHHEEATLQHYRLRHGLQGKF
ncbi:kinase-like protein [Phlegmacium glaucopus]|nr:kinase-like protein [Phlegmacium glaucopus]